LTRLYPEIRSGGVIVTTTTKGRRNLTLLSLLYDSGARVQEIYDLKFQGINLTSSSTVRLTGKG
jgi:site-specific recombinase XerD